MAKERQIHSIESAILGLVSAMEIDAIANPTEEQKMERQKAMLKAAELIKTSGIVTLAQHGDDTIETQHQVDEILEQGGIDRVQESRNDAIAGAIVTIETKQATEGDAEQDEIEEEIEAMEEEEQIEQEVGKPPQE